MPVGSKDIIFLLGAGASRDAGIPVSAEMISRLESLMKDQEEWKGFLSLYNHVRSSFNFSHGLRGVFGDSVPFHIEALVNTLYELERNEDHPLYPFIAAWNSRFVGLAGAKFERVADFRQKILLKLKDWMCPHRPSDAEYLKGFVALQKAVGHPLRIFSLNYDLLVEDLETAEFVVETGFAGFDPEHTWEFERFGERQVNPQVFLYKLHGSINWERNRDTKALRRVKQFAQVEPQKMDLIFGRDFKMEAADPYLFFAYEFRRLALEARLIVALGYGFGDDHINKMIAQSLRKDRERRLVVVQKCSAEEAPERRSKIAKILDVANNAEVPVIVLPGSVADLLKQSELLAVLTSHIPAPKDAPF